MSQFEFIHMPVPVDKFAAVCAVLAGTAPVGNAQKTSAPTATGAAKQDTAPNSAGEETLAPESPEPVGSGPTATNTASPSDEPDVEVDSDGIPFDPEMHTGTKLKSGQWRMKSGVERPEPVTDEEPETSEETEEDEFAAFKEAAAASDASETEAAENAPARTWTDADLGQLCNDAAVKLNDPAPVKEIIAQFVPEGEVPHSRNIPADKREEFAQAVEEKAGIEYAG